MLACLVACCLQAGCTKSGEAKTRAAQENAFRDAFGFAAPASIIEIKYADYYQREVMDGSYEQWLRCTFQAEVFDKMVKTKGYQRRGSSDLVSGSNNPAWWPAGNAGENTTFVLEGHDGPSHRAHLWHDQKTGFTYWHQVSWD